MASDVKWIKIVTDIFDDEKIMLIEAMPDADCIIVLWFKLLCLAGKQNNDGVFMLNERMPYTDEMLAHIFRRPLATVRYALKVFEQYGMIEIINDTITIPNWAKHQQLDSLNKRREYQRNLMARRRAEQKNQVLALTDANALADVSTLDIDKEEDKDNKNTTYSCSDLPSEDSEPPVYKIILNDKTYHGVTEADMARYRELYPGADVDLEMKKIIGWCESNPSKRKTKRGVKAFITNWLSRAQDRGRKPGGQVKPDDRGLEDWGVWTQ